MKFNRDKTIAILISIFVIILIVVTIYSLATFIISTSDALKAALLAACVAITAPYFSAHLQKDREIGLKLRDNKIKTYESVFQYLHHIVTATKKSTLDENDLVDRNYAVQHSLISGASPEVLILYTDFMAWITDQPDTSKMSQAELIYRSLEARSKMAKLVCGIRKDIGFKSFDGEHRIVADLMWPLAFDENEAVAQFQNELISAESIK